MVVPIDVRATDSSPKVRAATVTASAAYPTARTAKTIAVSVAAVAIAVSFCFVVAIAAVSAAHAPKGTSSAAVMNRVQ